MGVSPLAYHITFGTYGTRLHGDERGTVDRSMNRPGEPIIGCNEDWERVERSRLNFPPVVMSDAERLAVEALVPDICQRGGWKLRAVAAQPDHVHIVLSAPPDAAAKVVRKLLKRWLHQGLDERFPGAIPRGEANGDHERGCAASGARTPRLCRNTNAEPTWWAECGSIRWVWDEEYFESVYGYVRRQRVTR